MRQRGLGLFFQVRTPPRLFPELGAKPTRMVERYIDASLLIRGGNGISIIPQAERVAARARTAQQGHHIQLLVQQHKKCLFFREMQYTASF